MLKFLAPKNTDNWIDIVLIVFIRLVITGFTLMFGYLLAFGATMGPPIAPHVWNGNLDWGIRISIIIIGFSICIGVLIWSLLPLFRYIFRK
ncbi:hypothetical protein [Psychrobacter sp. 16-MNA-CIBAN-0192]|uniref:hypothetical protein n=1 Tax=Psychrobacter sp. 16-MNA-CIBAN-0192 TaxID=3140448 RepID=UPI0033166046